MTLVLGALGPLPEDPYSRSQIPVTPVPRTQSFLPTSVGMAYKQNIPTHKKHQNNIRAVEPKPQAEEMQRAAHTILSLHPQAQYSTWPIACIKEQASSRAMKTQGIPADLKLTT